MRLVKHATAEKESVHVLFPFAGAEPRIAYELTGGVGGGPCLPGSAATCRRSVTGSRSRTPTRPSPGHAAGAARPARQRLPALPALPGDDRRRGAGLVTSWVTNNVWETNFPLTQGGEMRFDYAVASAGPGADGRRSGSRPRTRSPARSSACSARRAPVPAGRVCELDAPGVEVVMLAAVGRRCRGAPPVVCRRRGHRAPAGPRAADRAGRLRRRADSGEPPLRPAPELPGERRPRRARACRRSRAACSRSTAPRRSPGNASCSAARPPHVDVRDSLLPWERGRAPHRRRCPTTPSSGGSRTASSPTSFGELPRVGRRRDRVRPRQRARPARRALVRGHAEAVRTRGDPARRRRRTSGSARAHAARSSGCSSSTGRCSTATSRSCSRGIDRYLDLARCPSAPRLVDGDALRRTLADARPPARSARCPTFFPGPWGGQWLRGELGIETDAPNLAWSYELIAPEAARS